MYLLNKVPNKVVSKTSFEFWKSRKPSLRPLNICGCTTKARVHNPHEKKLDSRTLSGYFIGYSVKSKVYIFYYPNHSQRTIETNNAKFLENGEVIGSEEQQNADIK